MFFDLRKEDAEKDVKVILNDQILSKLYSFSLLMLF